MPRLNVREYEFGSFHRHTIVPSRRDARLVFGRDETDRLPVSSRRYRNKPISAGDLQLSSSINFDSSVVIADRFTVDCPVFRLHGADVTFGHDEWHACIVGCTTDQFEMIDDLLRGAAQLVFRPAVSQGSGRVERLLMCDVHAAARCNPKAALQPFLARGRAA